MNERQDGGEVLISFIKETPRSPKTCSRDENDSESDINGCGKDLLFEELIGIPARDTVHRLGTAKSCARHAVMSITGETLSSEREREKEWEMEGSIGSRWSHLVELGLGG
jgi:hypothetical protein